MTRRRAALGAIAAGVLVFSATACSSDSDSSPETLPGVVAEDTGQDTGEDTAEDTAVDTAPSDAPTTQADAAPDATTPPAGGDSTAEPAPTDAAVAVPQALQFTAPLVGGGTFDGAAIAGKPTVFWFWAPT